MNGLSWGRTCETKSDIGVVAVLVHRELEKPQLLHAQNSKKIQYEAILVSDNNAFNFYLENRACFPRNPPVVFCGINPYKTAMGNAVGYWMQYVTIMDRLFYGADMMRNRSVKNWHVHDAALV
jgi:hypothetical protein